MAYLLLFYFIYLCVCVSGMYSFHKIAVCATSAG